MATSQGNSMSVPRQSSARNQYHQYSRSSTCVNMGDDVRQHQQHNHHHNHNHNHNDGHPYHQQQLNNNSNNNHYHHHYTSQHLASGSSLNTIATLDYRVPAAGLSSTGLQYQSTGMMTGYPRHQYSSSQAQLQSLTGPAIYNGGGGDTLRKTPNGQQRPQQQPSHKEYRSQLSLATNTTPTNAGAATATTTTTKPMMTSMLNDPSPFTATISRQPTVATSRTTFSNATTPHPVRTNANNGSAASHPLPPPYLQPTTTATSQQHMLNYLGGQAMSANINFPTPICHQQHQQQHPHPHSHPPFFHNLNQQNSTTATDTTEANSNCHQHPSMVGLSKSKSSLTCADISIKWYIIVIALLGLICALIGTIVGAVHSAGRDYISLALLLIGVGLVLVAISLIALRITIKTYKSSSNHHQTGSRSLARARSIPPTLRSAHMARLLAGGPGGGQQCSSSSSSTLPPPGSAPSSSLHRSLVQERLYMMAAAAAAMSHQQNPSGATSQQQEVQGVGRQQEPASAAQSGSIMSSIKRRLPHRLAKLIPCAGSSNQLLGPSPLTTSRRSGRPNTAASDQTAAAATNTMNSFILPNGLLDHSLATTNPAALAAAAHAILQQYQGTSLLPGGQLPAASAAAAAFLFPVPLAPPPPPPGALFGLPGLEYSFRPPPPSYNASMQDHRLRMLLQERAGLHQMNSMIPGGAHPAPPPPPPPPSVQGHQLERTNTMPTSSEDLRAVAGVGTQTSDTELCDHDDDDDRRLVGASSSLQSTTVVIGSGSGSITDARVQALQQTNLVAPAAEPIASANGLKPSASAPSIGALVTNDIYVTSGDCRAERQQQQPSSIDRSRRRRDLRHLKQLEAPASSANQAMPATYGSGCHVNNATIVNIGSSSTTVKPAASSYQTVAAAAANGGSNNNGKQQQQHRRSSCKSEAKILGYL